MGDKTENDKEDRNRMSSLQQGLKDLVVESHNGFDKIHEENVQHNAALDVALEAHVKGLIESQKVRDAKRQDLVVTAIKETMKHQHTDIKILLNELAKIHKALNIDFAQVDDSLGFIY